jgi:predicted transcriptional regulator with HTH domain
VAERSSAIVMEGLDQRQTGRGLLVVDGMIVEVDRNAVVAEEDNKSFVRMDQDRQMFVNRKDLAIVVRMMNPENRP